MKGIRSVGHRVDTVQDLGGLRVGLGEKMKLEQKPAGGEAVHQSYPPGRTFQALGSSQCKGPTVKWVLGLPGP